MPRWCLALGLVGCLSTTAAGADETLTRTALPGESPSATQRLESARKLARDRQFAEAVDEYQRLLEEAGDKLAPLSERQFVQVRWLCHLDLAALPPEGLRLYRNRVDAQAKKWYEQGAAERDPALLRRVVDEAFCSRFGDRALDLLGDLAFERGRFVEAGRWWRRIAVPAGAADRKADRPLDLVFPDPSVDVARVRAKQILALLFQPESAVGTDEVREELDAFRRLHPAAEGRLAGRSGSYAGILQALLEQRATLTAVPDAAATSFGGGPTRNLVLPPEPADPNRLEGLVRRWRFKLETHALLDDDNPLRDRAPSVANSRSLAFHPLIAGGQALVADARTVTAYDLRRGTSSVWYNAAAKNGVFNPAPTLPAPPDLSYTLTVADGCVFARLGAPALGPGKDNDGRDCDSLLVCLGLTPDARGERLRWQARPDAGNRDCAVFEGAPVVSDGRVYVAVTRFAGGRTVTAVHCYPVRAETAPALRWRQDVCETAELSAGQQRYRHHLLTLAGPNVVYCSHSGAIVALDTATGRHAWARRYPSRGPAGDDTPSPRGLAPCVYAGGRLYVAPADYDGLLCLDPATGQLLWERDKVEAVQLLGVARNRLIFTTPQGIRAVNAATGEDRGGWVQPDVGDLPPFGRGLLAGDLVFWPTLTRLYVLNQADGRQPDDLEPGPWQDVPRGNLVYGGGCLVVAGEKVLTVYVPPGWVRQEREEDVRRLPGSAAARYRLALAEADAGLAARALDDLDRAEALAAPGECWQGAALLDLTRCARQWVLTARSGRAEEEGHWQEAAAALAESAADAPLPERLEALRRQAALWERAGEPARAVAVWQGILADPALRGGRLADSHGNRQEAGLLAAAAIDALVRVHGPGVYEAEERQVRALLHAAKDDRRRPELERLAVEFPNAAVTGPALSELARLEEAAGHAGAAARAYRLMLRRGPPDAERAPALRELARAYEHQGCRLAARDAWRQLAREPGEQAAAEAELRKPEYQACEMSSPPDLALPLLHAWQIPLADDERLLPAHAAGAESASAVPDCVGPDLLFFSRGEALVCADPATGAPRWRASLPFVAEWAGRHADTVLAAGPGGAAALSVDDGVALWSFVPPATASAACPARPAPGREPLTDFSLTASQLFFRQGKQRLVTLDAETGRVLWTAVPPSAGLGLPEPSGCLFHYLAAEDWVAVQVSGGKLWLLDSRTGALRHELETSREPWPAAPFAPAERSLCLVDDVRTVVLVDPTTGRELARPPLIAPTTLSGQAPEVVGGRGVLLLLTARNFGFTLQRLDPLTGRALWPDERLLGPGRVGAAGVTFDGDAVYCPGGGVLQARALGDGRPLWSVPLPPAGRDWRTLRAGQYLVAYPADVGARSVQCRGLFGTLSLTAVFPAYDRITLGVPVLFLDPKTGQLVERLSLPTAGPRVAARGPLQAAGLLPQFRLDEPDLRLQLSREAVIAAVAGRAWSRTGRDRQ